MAILGLGCAWLALKVTKNPHSRVALVAWICGSILSLGYLAIDKLIGVGYTKGFYGVIALTLVTGVGGGLALRKYR